VGRVGGGGTDVAEEGGTGLDLDLVAEADLHAGVVIRRQCLRAMDAVEAE